MERFSVLLFDVPATAAAAPVTVAVAAAVVVAAFVADLSTFFDELSAFLTPDDRFVLLLSPRTFFFRGTLVRIAAWTITLIFKIKLDFDLETKLGILLFKKWNLPHCCHREVERFLLLHCELLSQTLIFY